MYKSLPVATLIDNAVAKTTTDVSIPHTWEFEVTKGEWFTVEGDLFFEIDPGERESRDCPGMPAHAVLNRISVREIEGQTTDKPATRLSRSVMPQLFAWIENQLMDMADDDEMQELCFDRIAEDYER